MTPRPRPRVQPCGRKEALARIARARAFLTARTAALETQLDTSGNAVAASLAVLAGIAAADAACCSAIGARSRSATHADAAALLANVHPHDPAMAKDFERLISRKDDAHYGATLVSHRDASNMLKWATRIFTHAQSTIAR